MRRDRLLDKALGVSISITIDLGGRSGECHMGQGARQLFWGLGLGLWGCAVPQGIGFQAIALAPSSIDHLMHPAFLRQPALANTYRQQGLQYRQQADLGQAIAALKTAVALDPTNISGYVVLGWTQHLAGQEAAAATTLQQALLRQSDSVEALNALGIVQLVTGDLTAVIATHTQAKTLKPDNEIAYYNLSLAYQRLPDFPQAIAHAQRATELEAANPHPWVALAIAYDSQGDPENARKAYQTAVSLDGRYRDRAHLAHLTQAGFSTAQIQQVDVIRQNSL